MSATILGTPGSNLRLIPLGYVQIAALAGGSALPASPSGTATLIAMTCEGTAVRWRDDGTAPTSTSGFPLAAGDTLVYAGLLSALQIAPYAGTPQVDILYYRQSG